MNSFSGLIRRQRFLLLIILLSYAALQAAVVIKLPLTYDDGLNLQVIYLVEQGYRPYTQIFTLAAPLFIWLTGWLGSLSPQGVKLVFLLFGLLLLANIFSIARAMLGLWAALASIFLLAFTSTYLVESTQVVAITPALSLATLSPVWALRYLQTRRRRWLFFSGAAWGIALFVSAAVVSVGPAALLFVIFFKANEHRLVATSLNWQNIRQPAPGLWLGSVAVVIGVGLSLTGPIIVELFRAYGVIYRQLPAVESDNFVLIGQFVALNIWVFLPAIYGLLRVYESPSHPLWLIFSWGLLSFGWLMLQPTLRPVDTTILLPPLVIMAGWGIVCLGQNHFRQTISPGWRVGLGLAAPVLLLFAGWQQLDNFRLRDINIPDDLIQLEQRPQIVAFIQQHSTPNDCVIIDDAALAIDAWRFPSPGLAGLTRERISGGLLTQQNLQFQVEELNCKAVIFSKRVYTLPLLDFKDWAKQYFPNQQQFTRTDIYYR